MLALVQLPSAATVSTLLCPTGASGTDCIDAAQPDGHKQNAKSGYVRVGHHAYDRSYVQYFLGHSDSDKLNGANVSIEYSVSGPGNNDIDLLVTPFASSNSSQPGVAWANGAELVLDLRFAWFRAGNVSAAANSVTLSPAGLAPMTLHATAAGKPSATQLRLPLGKGAVGLSTTAGRSVASIQVIPPVRRSTPQMPNQRINWQALLKAAAAKEEALLTTTYKEYAGHAMAIKGSAMWNLIYNPAENGAPLIPVSVTEHDRLANGCLFPPPGCVFKPMRSAAARLELRTVSRERRLDGAHL